MAVLSDVTFLYKLIRETNANRIANGAPPMSAVGLVRRFGTEAVRTTRRPSILTTLLVNYIAGVTPENVGCVAVGVTRYIAAEYKHTIGDDPMTEYLLDNLLLNCPLEVRLAVRAYERSMGLIN